MHGEGTNDGSIATRRSRREERTKDVGKHSNSGLMEMKKARWEWKEPWDMMITIAVVGEVAHEA